MQNPLIIGCIVFLILLAGAFASWTIRQRLPEHHLTDDTKSLVSVSMQPLFAALYTPLT